VAAKNADYVVVTSDNPRHEDPQRIIDQILTGCQSQSCVSIVDRKNAIKHAINLAEENDVVLIAGKGHEKFQIIGNEAFPFDDVSIAEQLLSENQHG
jgi:UDP-N-acetylmuramoyl-L-alanyl-D-glutamate--2,6-diaminopimelate ligase